MFNLLFERDREEALRITNRTLTFPDGTERKVAAYRMVWRWYDHLVAYEFAPDAPELLRYVLRTVEAQRCPIGEALGQVVQYFVVETEARGGDVTDDNLMLGLARAQMKKWRDRRRGQANG